MSPHQQRQGQTFLSTEWHHRVSMKYYGALYSCLHFYAWIGIDLNTEKEQA